MPARAVLLVMWCRLFLDFCSVLNRCSFTVTNATFLRDVKHQSLLLAFCALERLTLLWWIIIVNIRVTIFMVLSCEKATVRVHLMSTAGAAEQGRLGRLSPRQSCSLGLDVSVSRRSRDVFFKRLGLVSVSAKCGKVSVSVSSRTESQTSRSRLGLGPQRLVYKWTFKQIFLFLSFSYKTNMSDICFSYIASSCTCFRFVKSST